MSNDNEVTSEGNAEKKPSYFLVPADDNGVMCVERSIPIHDSSQLNMVLAPIMPMYDLKCSSMLIPMSESGLRKVLSKYKSIFPARYRFTTTKDKGIRVKVRLLTATEINQIRSLIFTGPGKLKVV
jgi:hypothetical protein